MTDSLKIALAQINPRMGDIAGNARLLRDARAQAAKDNADLVVCPELTLSGYPPEDLVLKRSFLAKIREAAEALAAETDDGGPAMLVGAPWEDQGKRYNALLLLDQGKIAAIRYKHHLPNYGVFDEARVFAPGPCPGPVAFRGLRLGIMVCEDMWFSDVAETLEESGAEILIVSNGSPFEIDKSGVRLSHAVARVTETKLPLLYVNQIGGQDELVFDGGSFVLDSRARPQVILRNWVSEIVTTEWTRGAEGWTTSGPMAKQLTPLEDIWQAMVLGLRDYVGKNRFPGVLIGLSGGIDSAISAAVAVDALGADRVHCVMMPSPYTSQESLDDAEGVAKLLGIRLYSISIAPAMAAFGQMLAPQFAETQPDITEENLQSRARGMTLMALSNKFGKMVLSTGNKSEMSTGYATLYGDMCGGYSVLKDVYKTTVFELSSWRNANKPGNCLGPDGPVMPERVITKPPSAELKPDQRDQDSLPPYDMLDAILRHLIEDELGVSDIVAKGYEDSIVRRVWQMLDRAEYKRRQAPPGVKITSRAFGRDRRYPITNAFTGTE